MDIMSKGEKVHATWKGTLSLGLVNVPVVLSTTKDRSSEPSGTMVHSDDLGKIKYHRVCESCDEQVPWEKIGKAYDRDGELVLVDTSDLSTSGSKVMEIKQFCPSEQISPMLYEETYWLTPDIDKGTTKGYGLLVETFSSIDKVALAMTKIRSKPRLAVIRPEQGMLALHMLRWPETVKPRPDVPVEQAGDGEKALAIQLVSALSKDFDPSEYSDERTDEIKARIAASQTIVPAGDEDEDLPDNVTSLISALKNSVENVSA